MQESPLLYLQHVVISLEYTLGNESRPSGKGAGVFCHKVLVSFSQRHRLGFLYVVIYYTKNQKLRISVLASTLIGCVSLAESQLH